MHERVQIDTQDGRCEAHVLRPDKNTPAPAVLMYQDGLGMRDALVEIAATIAQQGYFVLLPNLFYRTGGGSVNPMTFFGDAAARRDWMDKVISQASAAKVMTDTESFLAYLDTRSEAKATTIGITCYCMGGRMSLTAAGTFGDRIACAAAFHPGGLATDKPDSPHLLADRIRAEIYIAGAIDDSGFDDAQKSRLSKALNEGGVKYTLETYPAKHGWVPSDTPVHDPGQAERHFTNLFALLSRSMH
jgi:carboxymethylenebutenolidase